MVERAWTKNRLGEAWKVRGLYDGAEPDVFEVRHLRGDDGV